MTSSFSVVEHVISCQHIRGYRFGSKSQHVPLRLAIKEYQPKDPGSFDVPSPVTIIAGHANGLPKEVYEPLWDELHSKLRGRIQAIWIADCAHQGASGVLNEQSLGDDPHWHDHSRDLLVMINHFASRIRPPIIGIGHSMGAVQLLHLSHLHPTLFHSLALVEPIIQIEVPPGPNAALPSTFRQDLWPSLDVARSALRENPFFRSWDIRAFEQYVTYGLRSVPTALYPSASEGSVTLTTTKHQEAWSYLRSNFTGIPERYQSQILAPDLGPDKRKKLFHRAEVTQAFKDLPSARPNILWVFGSSSHINPTSTQEEKVDRTGTGVGGTGGVDSGRVEKEVISGGSHMLPVESPNKVATSLANWIQKQLQDFEAVEDFWEKYDSNRSERDMLAVSKSWRKNIKLPSSQRRQQKL